MTESRQVFENKNILISGGLGFIGSNLAIRLVEYGANVTIVDNLIPEYGGNPWNIEPVKHKINLHISDVRDEHTMKYLIQDQDIFFNLAGQRSHLDSMKNPFEDLEVNTKAQVNILEASRKYNPGIKIIYASTRQLYGQPQYLPVDEQHPVVPVDVNGINKLSAEMYHNLYNRVYGIKTAILRLTNTYGPRMRIKDARQTFLGIWIRNLLENKPLTIFGDGNQIRDFNYIDDVVDAFILVAGFDKLKGAVYNLGHNEPQSLKETAEIMIRENKGGNYIFKPFPGDLKKIDIGDFYSNFEKIRETLGWAPQTSFAAGIRKTLDFYYNNTSHYL
jgi:UDP-glucose 4-epimerase